MASGEKIIQLPSGSPNDNSLGIVADPDTGRLYKAGYKSLKDYFQNGVKFDTGSLATTASLNDLSSSYHIDSGSFDTRIKALSGSQSNLTGSYVATGSFNAYTASIGLQIANVYASESNYLPTASYLIDSASFDSRFKSLSGSIINVYASESNYLPTSSFLSFSASVHSQLTGSTNVINFIIGDGQSFTPATGSTVFSSSILANKKIIQFQQEGFTIAPISRSAASWYSFTSSIGKINLNNTVFIQDSYFQLIYT